MTSSVALQSLIFFTHKRGLIIDGCENRLALLGCTFHWKKWASFYGLLNVIIGGLNHSKKFEFVKFLLHNKVHIMDTLPNEPKVQSKDLYALVDVWVHLCVTYLPNPAMERFCGVGRRVCA